MIIAYWLNYLAAHENRRASLQNTLRRRAGRTINKTKKKNEK